MGEMMMTFDVTLIVPFHNEEKAFGRALESLAGQDLGELRAEVLLIDGMSDDGSAAIASTYVVRGTDRITFRLLGNPKRTTPAAFNRGIWAAKAPIVGFGGAHTECPRHYLRTAVELLRTTDVWVVGGGLHTYLPGDGRILSHAVSLLYQSFMGAGVAAYHRRREPGFVDTVYGGFYRRSVFEQVGLFNEALERNQDNEFNARVTASGGTMYFHPSLSVAYIHRP